MASAARFRRSSEPDRSTRPFHPRSRRMRAAGLRSSSGEMAVARTSENTGVYLPSAFASPFIFTSEAIGKACAVVILKQAAMRLPGINGITVHRTST